MTINSLGYDKHSVEVLGRRMAYVEAGQGDPIVFLHGNPTSSYLWRNVMPYLEQHGRCIAPDLIGMGDSDASGSTGADAYSFVEHRQYMDALLATLGVDRNVIFVVHDWGSALGFDWACRHSARVQGIAYMEAIVQPVSWAQWPAEARDIFRTMRGAAGEQLVLDKNIFVERILPASIQRDLSDHEMNEYRRPFRNAGESRRPTLTWPRQIPIDGEPADVHDIVAGYGRWLAQDDSVAKLFINADPGMILSGEPREFCRSWPNQEEVTVPGLHFIQEDAPEAIGTHVARFAARLRSP